MFDSDGHGDNRVASVGSHACECIEYNRIGCVLDALEDHRVTSAYSVHAGSRVEDGQGQTVNNAVACIEDTLDRIVTHRGIATQALAVPEERKFALANRSHGVRHRNSRITFLSQVEREADTVATGLVMERVVVRTGGVVVAYLVAVYIPCIGITEVDHVILDTVLSLIEPQVECIACAIASGFRITQSVTIDGVLSEVTEVMSIHYPVIRFGRTSIDCSGRINDDALYNQLQTNDGVALVIYDGTQGIVTHGRIAHQALAVPEERQVALAYDSRSIANCNSSRACRLNGELQIDNTIRTVGTL